MKPHETSSESVEALDLLLSGPDLVVVTKYDPAVIVAINPRFLEVFGFRKKDVVGKTTVELDIWVNSLDRRLLRTQLQTNRGFENQPVSLRTAEGEIRHFRMSASIKALSGRDHIIVFFRDDTERHLAEQELKRIRPLLERAEEMANIGSWEFNFGTGEVLGSPGAHRIYGVPEGSLSIELAESVPLPEFRPMMNQARDDLIKRGIPYDVEFQIQRRDDGVIADIHSRAVWDPEKRILFGIIRDVTEEKRARKVLEAVNTELRDKVGSTLSQLEDVKTDLLRAKTVAALNSLVAKLAHEMNTPLGNALTASTFIKDHAVPRKVDEDIVSAAVIIENSTQRLAGLVNRFKQLGVVGGSSAPQVETLVLPDFVELLVRSIDLPKAVKDRITVSCEDGTWSAAFDFVSVAEAITELVSNAFLHNVDPGPVEISIRRDTRALEVSVSDRGKGIERVHWERIFEPFYTTSVQAGRAGLGLSIIHNQIVERARGSFYLDENHTPGARFVVKVPLSQM